VVLASSHALGRESATARCELGVDLLFLTTEDEERGADDGSAY
jgi:hypothetical protein